MAWIQCSWASLKRNIMPITISKVVIPGHPPELSDDVRLLLIDTWRQVLEIYLVLKSMHWHFLVADTQHYMRLGPSVRPLVRKGRKVEQRAFWILFIYVCVWSGVRSVDGDWMPLPTRPQRYCDPASLVLKFFYFGQVVCLFHEIEVKHHISPLVVHFLYFIRTSFFFWSLQKR